MPQPASRVPSGKHIPRGWVRVLFAVPHFFRCFCLVIYQTKTHDSELCSILHTWASCCNWPFVLARRVFSSCSECVMRNTRSGHATATVLVHQLLLWNCPHPLKFPTPLTLVFFDIRIYALFSPFHSRSCRSTCGKT